MSERDDVVSHTRPGRHSKAPGEVMHAEPGGYPPMVAGMSTNDYTNALLAHHGKQRWSHEGKGKLLLLPRTGLVVVPFEMTTGAGWNVVVVRPDALGTYQPGGYSLYVGDAEIETAVELDVTRALPPDPREQPMADPRSQHPLLRDLVNGPSLAGHPAGSCWICGDPTDHLGVPHNRAVGDDLDRYVVAQQYLQRWQDTGAAARGFLGQQLLREAEASVALDREPAGARTAKPSRIPPTDPADELMSVLEGIETIIGVDGTPENPEHRAVLPRGQLRRWHRQITRATAALLDRESRPVVAAPDVESTSVLAEIRQLLEAVVGGGDPGMEGRPAGSVAIPLPTLVRWRDDLDQQQQDDEDGTSCRACRDVVHTVGTSGLCAGCEEAEASWRARVHAVVTWLDRLAFDAEHAPGTVTLRGPDSADHTAAVVRVDALRAHAGELRLLQDRPL